MTTDTPLRYITVVYEIVDENEWRKTNPLNYAHNGLSAVRVCIHDACEKLEKSKAEVERLKEMVKEAARKGDELLEPYRLRAEKAETLIKQIYAFVETKCKFCQKPIEEIDPENPTNR